MVRASKPIVTVKNLSKKYGSQTVVNGISFKVKKGEIFGVVIHYVALSLKGMNLNVPQELPL